MTSDEQRISNLDCSNVAFQATKLALFHVTFGEGKAKECLSMVDNRTGQKEVRIFMDGAFDLMHFGHMNAFRLAKSLGTHLVVGINSEKSITECKGPPLMNDDARMTMVKSCKFVDEIVMDCPYIMSQEYLDWVVKEYRIDFVVHGDDPCIVDGKDVYATAKESGKFRTIPRTEGVSTTELVGRILSYTEHQGENGGDSSPLANRSKFLTTGYLLKSFGDERRPPQLQERVVYVDGAWDLLNPDHIAMLEAARKYGDYLMVGVHNNQVVNKRMGMRLPLLSLNERVLGVMGCCFVDDVLVDAPLTISQEMISQLRIHCVVQFSDCKTPDELVAQDSRLEDAHRLGILAVEQRPTASTFQGIASRVRRDQDHFQAKFKRKMEAETQFYKRKHSNPQS